MENEFCFAEVNSSRCFIIEEKFGAVGSSISLGRSAGGTFCSPCCAVWLFMWLRGHRHRESSGRSTKSGENS